ncbi:hypothetical protein ABZ499_14740 [Streptomyces sp. NPDC019990]|uniref:hypothetical protein n=1 Tax=Streptomyces sp. NPDC019990 TaxID=3154693 RepID=UPI0033C7EC5A
MRANRALLAAAAVITALAVTGCGGDDGGPKVPTAASGGASSPAAGGSGEQSGGDDVAAYVQAQRVYVKCLRDNGFDAPDPDAQGNIDFGSGDARVALKKDPKFRAATQKCAEFQPAVPEDLEKGNQKLTPEQIEVKREYADCMQKNGASDFPDPGPDGLGQGEWDQSSAGAKRAIRICGPIVGVPENAGPGKG